MFYFNKNKRVTVRGFTVVEILVALGLVAIIGAGLTSVMTSASKQQKGIQAKDQQREITAELRTLLSDRTACFNSFGNLGDPMAGYSVPAIKDNAAVDRYNLTTLSTDKTGLLQFKGFDVSEWTAATGNAVLRVKLAKTGDTGTVKDILPDIITLKAKRDGVTGMLTECFSIGTVSDSFWKVGADPSDIFFSAGKVGIGTNAPLTLLEVRKDQPSGSAIRLVNNDMSATSSVQYEFAGAGALGGGGAFGMGQGTWGSMNPGDVFLYGYRDLMIGSTSGAHSIRFFIPSTPSGPPVDIMRIDVSGRVGIGTSVPTEKLHVVGNINATGSVKTGTAVAGSACTSVGAFAYAPASNAPVYCNNSSVWTVMGGSVASVPVYLCPTVADNTYGRTRVWPGSPAACAGQLTTHSSCSTLTPNSSYPCTLAGYIYP